MILYNSFVQLCAKNCISFLSSFHTALSRLPSALASVYIYMCVYKLYIYNLYFGLKVVRSVGSCVSLQLSVHWQADGWSNRVQGGKLGENSHKYIWQDSYNTHTHSLHHFCLSKSNKYIKTGCSKNFSLPWQWPNGINWLFIINCI